uniref:Uncharacterized protein n=1 Tax=Anguilla anguilla TaxID=7936 RepID=A0A0E9T212_ANGAN
MVIFMVIRPDINAYNFSKVLLNVRDKMRCWDCSYRDIIPL